uniref:Uncharacterized protein n=1 Tax=Rhizophora mucronata TaxID=61149 RepID=A0A2P2JGY8_RHIMU
MCYLVQLFENTFSFLRVRAIGFGEDDDLM